MADATMTRVCDSDDCMHGPRKLLVCGYSTQAQDDFLALMDREIRDGLPVVFCLPEDGDTTLIELLSRDDGHNKSQEGRMPPAIIMSGITERELKQIMSAWKELNLPRQLWAALTPTSESWTLRQLIRELQAEFKAMMENQKKD